MSYRCDCITFQFDGERFAITQEGHCGPTLRLDPATAERMAHAIRDGLAAAKRLRADRLAAERRDRIAALESELAELKAAGVEAQEQKVSPEK